MQQAAVLDGPALDRVPPFQNGLTAPGIDVGGRQIAEAFVVSAVVVVVDEAADLGFCSPSAPIGQPERFA